MNDIGYQMGRLAQWLIADKNMPREVKFLAKVFRDDHDHSMVTPDEVIMRLCSAHGWERCAWGSDFPWMSQTEALEGLLRLGLDDATLEGVLAGNLRRLLDID